MGILVVHISLLHERSNDRGISLIDLKNGKIQPNKRILLEFAAELTRRSRNLVDVSVFLVQLVDV